MSAVLLRSRPDGSALRSIGLLSHRIHASRTAITTGRAASRALHAPRRRPFPRCFASTRPADVPLLSVRHKSAVAEAPNGPRQSSAISNIIFKAFAYCGFFIVSSGAAVVAFFIYDATTYRDDSSAEDIPVSELALNPRHGGPKNLPIAEVLVSDSDSEEIQKQNDKPRLVILGTGWGSVALLKHLDPDDYHVTVVSPTNYFLFTPMLPSATVGTLGLRSLVEPVRRIIQQVNGHFLKARAEDVDFSEKLVEISQEDANGHKKSFYLPYDKLVIGVGMVTCLFC